MLVLAGCMTVNHCLYDLEENGWSPNDGVPDSISLDPENSEADYFTNDQGNWLACRDLGKDNMCDHVVIYDKQPLDKKVPGTQQDYMGELVICIYDGPSEYRWFWEPDGAD
jgi:hypothetical protein